MNKTKEKYYQFEVPMDWDQMKMKIWKGHGREIESNNWERTKENEEEDLKRDPRLCDEKNIVF